MWIGRGKILEPDDKWQRNYEYCDLRANETQMTEKYIAENVKMASVDVKIGSRDVNGN